MNQFKGKAFFVRDVPRTAGCAKVYRIEHPPLPAVEISDALDDRDEFGESLPPFVVASTANIGIIFGTVLPFETLIVSMGENGRGDFSTEHFGRRDKDYDTIEDLHRSVFHDAGYELVS